MTTLHVLGSPLLVCDYDSLGASCLDWSRQAGCTAIDFANTQIVTMRRHDLRFRELTARF